MNGRKKAVFNWSGGKDAALALQKALCNDHFEVVSLLTAINSETLTSSVHSIPLEILERQADSIGIPLYTVSFAPDLSNYDAKMQNAVSHFKRQGVTHFIFGDIFLADVKAARARKLNPLGIRVAEPLWGKSSSEIMDEFLGSGIKAKIIVTQADKLDKKFVGRELHRDTIDLFPPGIDVCGENGEYHTLSYAGGLFKKKIDFSISKVNKVSYDIRLDNGHVKTFEYWQGEIVAV